MDSTEWIALAIVAAAALFLLRGYLSKNKKKKCCDSGCAVKPEAKKEITN